MKVVTLRFEDKEFEKLTKIKARRDMTWEEIIKFAFERL